MSDVISELRTSWRGQVGVDEDAGVIRGMVLAEAGPFKTGRGQFDVAALEEIARLINEAGGVPSYMSHDHARGEGEGTYLGEITNAKVDRDPKPARVRADLTFDPAAKLSPKGDWAPYVMAQARSNPRRIGSSLALAHLREEAPAVNGRRQPPIWRPKHIISADIVGVGDAVSSLLEAEETVAEDAAPNAERMQLLRRRLTALLKVVRSR